MSSNEAGGASVGTPERLRSLDAFRGFIMLAMASGGLGLMQVAANLSRETGEETRLDFVARQFDHVAWRGCVFWDLIQPAFMFMVGVALPFSVASRTARGQSWFRQFGHALWRSLILVALGVFLASAWSTQTNWTFTNVLAQIGLGYWFVFLMVGRPACLQFLVALIILVGDWAFFALHPLPGSQPPPARFGPESNSEWQIGFAEHWEKGRNAAADFDRWFLNRFPRAERFEFNEGGYQTLNFVPSIVTMLFGVMAGSWLRSARTERAKVRGLFLAGAAGLIAGTLLDPVAHAIPPMQTEAMVLCPLIKRLWTPSWTIYSAGWAVWMLALFYVVIDVGRWRSWAFPFVVVGMNSIAMYMMSQLTKGWVRRQLEIHVGTLFTWLHETFELPLDRHIFAGTYGPLIQSVSVLAVLWLVCLWLYRKRIFLRI